MKQYVGISRDHSKSMYNIATAAAKDYNTNIAAIQSAASQHNIDTIVSVVKCGIGSRATVEREVVNSNVQVLKPLSHYETSGHGTPLWDSVGELICLLSSAPDADDREVSFLVMIITDGQENYSANWTASSVSSKIRELQNTDRWTFVFRVPRGQALSLARMGIPEGNIQEWDQTTRGLETATVATASAVSNYYTNRGKGVSSTGKFYADIGNVSVATVAKELKDISHLVYTLPVDASRNGMAIKEYVELWRLPYILGEWFYQISKTEKVQASKMICVQDRNTSRFYSGSAARRLLGLPEFGDVTLTPGNMGHYNVFIQSTSVNRKLVGGTKLIRMEKHNFLGI